MAKKLELPEEMKVGDKTLRFPYGDTLPLPPKEKLQSLHEDVQRNRVISAVVITPSGDDEDVYEVLDGNTRLRIVHDLGWGDEKRAEIPISVREGLSDGDKFLAVLRYNEARRDSVAKSKTTRRKWVQKIKEVDGRIGYRQIASALGVSHMTVKRDLERLDAEANEEYRAVHEQRKRAQRRRDYISSVAKWLDEPEVDTGLSKDELKVFKSTLEQVKESWEAALEELRSREVELAPDRDD